LTHGGAPGLYKAPVGLLVEPLIAPKLTRMRNASVSAARIRARGTFVNALIIGLQTVISISVDATVHCPA